MSILIIHTFGGAMTGLYLRMSHVSKPHMSRQLLRHRVWGGVPAAGGGCLGAAHPGPGAGLSPGVPLLQLGRHHAPAPHAGGVQVGGAQLVMM